jgi:uncharacterized protein related to proFAR isomerase
MVMTEVILYSTTVTETLEIVHSLRERLFIDVDFQYKFIQGKYDWEQSEQIDHKTIFYFRDPAEATAFRLKYL